jgi:hypothetical protein
MGRRTKETNQEPDAAESHDPHGGEERQPNDHQPSKSHLQGQSANKIRKKGRERPEKERNRTDQHDKGEPPDSDLQPDGPNFDQTDEQHEGQEQNALQEKKTMRRNSQEQGGVEGRGP